VADTDPDKPIVKVKNMQIADGRQTTSTLPLTQVVGQLTPDVRVLLRICETQDLDLQDKIVLTTNNQNKITEETCDRLRSEWKDKLRADQEKLRNPERDVSRYVDDLQMTLMLMTQMSQLFDRLDDKAKHKLVRILINQIIVVQDARIVDFKLNRPFGYQNELATDPKIKLKGQGGSKQVPFGVQEV
jgi:hypothetical protein